jgi:para-aminobenzoate synthetase
VVKTLIIDNYDSYTYNLFQLISEVNGDEAVVVRNDAATWEELSRQRFDNVVISPGPGTPERPGDFGICTDALATPDLPILGVCLGHQGLAHVNGGAVVQTPGAVHGRISPVFHDESPLFAGIPQGFAAVRYHSLRVDDVLPEAVRRRAWTADGTVMGLSHLQRPHWGVQFHPESVCTEHGRRLLENFRDLSHTSRARPRRARTPAERKRPSRPSGGPQVFWRRIDELVDPETAFVRLYGRRRFAYWLDSSLVSDGLSRFSYMGASGGPLSRVVSYDAARRRVTARDAESVSTHDETIFSYLERELSSLACTAEGLPFDLTGGFAGYFGYEVKADCGSPLRHRSPWPDAQFILSDRLIVFDHLEGHTYTVCLARNEADARSWMEQTVRELKALAPLPAPAGSAAANEFTPWRERSRYLDDIAACKREIAAGESYEICLTNEFRSSAQVDPLTVYRELRRRNPAPHAAFLRFGRMSILSSSPERFLHIDRDGWIEAKPIKGTAPRGATAAEDDRIRDTLATSEKTRAENLMIVDLLRNDLGAVSQLGSVSVPKLMDVETYRTLHQLVSTIRGRRREDVSPVECIRAAFPPGSMTGAPKLRTMDIIDRLEGRPRGVYSGAIGFLGLNQAVDLSVVIRTLVADQAGCSIGTGGAIVAQSVPEEEHDETLLKARALLEAVVSAGKPQPSVEEILASGYLTPPGEFAPRTLSAVAWRG